MAVHEVFALIAAALEYPPVGSCDAVYEAPWQLEG